MAKNISIKDKDENGIISRLSIKLQQSIQCDNVIRVGVWDKKENSEISYWWSNREGTAIIFTKHSNNGLFLSCFNF